MSTVVALTEASVGIASLPMFAGLIWMGLYFVLLVSKRNMLWRGGGLSNPEQRTDHLQVMDHNGGSFCVLELVTIQCRRDLLDLLKLSSACL